MYQTYKHKKLNFASKFSNPLNRFNWPLQCIFHLHFWGKSEQNKWRHGLLKNGSWFFLYVILKANLVS